MKSATQMQVHAMRFNDVLEEINEERLAICVAYEIRTLGECLTKAKEEESEGWDELEND